MSYNHLQYAPKYLALWIWFLNLISGLKGTPPPSSRLREGVSVSVKLLFKLRKKLLKKKKKAMLLVMLTHYKCIRLTWCNEYICKKSPFLHSDSKTSHFADFRRSNKKSKSLFGPVFNTWRCNFMPSPRCHCLWLCWRQSHGAVHVGLVLQLIRSCIFIQEMTAFKYVVGKSSSTIVSIKSKNKWTHWTGMISASSD